MEYTEKKYRLIKKADNLYQIEALRTFGLIAKGTRGGYVSSYGNLSQTGNCWIHEGSYAFGHSMVADNAIIGGGVTLRDYAVAKDNAYIVESTLEGHAMVGGDASVTDHCVLSDNVSVYGNAYILDNVKMKDNVVACDNAFIKGDVTLYNTVTVRGSGQVVGMDVIIRGDGRIETADGLLLMQSFMAEREPFAYTRSNNKWSFGELFGDDEEMKAEIYSIGMRLGKHFEAMIQYKNEVYKLVENK